MVFGIIFTDDIDIDVQKENLKFFKLEKKCFHTARDEAKTGIRKILKSISNHTGHIHEAVGRALTYTKIMDCVYMIAVRSSKKII